MNTKNKPSFLIALMVSMGLSTFAHAQSETIASQIQSCDDLGYAITGDPQEDALGVKAIDVYYEPEVNGMLTQTKFKSDHAEVTHYRIWESRFTFRDGSSIGGECVANQSCAHTEKEYSDDEFAHIRELNAKNMMAFYINEESDELNLQCVCVLAYDKQISLRSIKTPLTFFPIPVPQKNESVRLSCTERD